MSVGVIGKICSKCSKDIEGTRPRSTLCRVCGREASKKGRHKYVSNSQKYIFQYLLDNPCVDCGEADPVCLDFDHVRGKKLGNISKIRKRGSNSQMLKDEIAKCEVRCANCHRKVTEKQYPGYKTLLKKKPSLF